MFPDDSLDTEDSRDAFGRYLPISSANTHIRPARLNATSTQDVQVVGISTTKTGYVIRFKEPVLAERPSNSTERLNELGNDQNGDNSIWSGRAPHPDQGLDLDS